MNIKQSIIIFYLDYVNSGLNMAEYAANKNLTENECKMTIRLGISFAGSAEWVEHKNIIMKCLSEKNINATQLAKNLGISSIYITETLRLKRGLPQRYLNQIKELV